MFNEEGSVGTGETKPKNVESLHLVGGLLAKGLSLSTQTPLSSLEDDLTLVVAFGAEKRIQDPLGNDDIRDCCG